jgi:hypothetical protein
MSGVRIARYRRVSPAVLTVHKKSKTDGRLDAGLAPPEMSGGNPAAGSKLSRLGGAGVTVTAVATVRGLTLSFSAAPERETFCKFAEGSMSVLWPCLTFASLAATIPRCDSVRCRRCRLSDTTNAAASPPAYWRSSSALARVRTTAASCGLAFNRRGRAVLGDRCPRLLMPPGRR